MASPLAQFQNVSDADKTAAVKRLVEVSTPDYDFFFLVVLSILMATFGLWINSVEIVIGSMLIAPILYPILSLSLGIVMSDFPLISRSLLTILKSALLGILGAVLATWLFAAEYGEFTSEILLRTEPSLLYLAVAVIAGIAVSFTLVRPDLSETLAGIAVSVALIPPLAVVGIGIAKFDLAVVSGSAVLLLVNIIGIVFASMVAFSLLSLHDKRYVAQTAIKKEEERVELEHERAEFITKEDKESGEQEEAPIM